MNRPSRSLLTAGIVMLAVATGTEAQVSGARQGLLSLEDARIFYEVVGAGTPIVVVHGGPGLDHNYLKPGLNVLAARHRLVYYDQRGTGRSSTELDSTSVNLDTFMGDIEALRQVLELPQITVLGHSFGALLALEYAHRYPDRLRGLILMNPTEPGARFQEQTAARQARARTEEDQARLAELTGSEAFAARDPATLSEVYRVAFRGTFKDRDRVSELNLDLARSTAEAGQDVARLLGGSMGSVDWWDRLPSTEVPTLVLHGRYDIPPLAMSEALAAALPNGSLAVLDAGHFPFVEDPEGLAAAVSGFFAGLGR